MVCGGDWVTQLSQSTAAPENKNQNNFAFGQLKECDLATPQSNRASPGQLTQSRILSSCKLPPYITEKQK